MYRIRTFFAHLSISIGATIMDVFKDDKAKTDKWRMWISKNVLRSTGLTYEVKRHLNPDTDLNYWQKLVTISTKLLFYIPQYHGLRIDRIINGLIEK